MLEKTVDRITDRIDESIRENVSQPMRTMAIIGLAALVIALTALTLVLVKE